MAPASSARSVAIWSLLFIRLPDASKSPARVRSIAPLTLLSLSCTHRFPKNEEKCERIVMNKSILLYLSRAVQRLIEEEEFLDTFFSMLITILSNGDIHFLFLLCLVK